MIDLAESLQVGRIINRHHSDGNLNNVTMHIRGFVDDQVVYRVWHKRFQAWRYVVRPMAYFTSWNKYGILVACTGHTVEQVLAAECTLEPMVCKLCGSNEVTFHQYIGDAHCADCDSWQLSN